MHWQDRIKELRRVKASSLQANPHNWRVHSELQKSTLQAVLSEIGIADALLVRELDDGRLELIDGHLRAETAEEQLVPVLVLDVTEEEAKKILLTHDPLGAMADTDRTKVAELLQQLDSPERDLQGYLESLGERNDAEQGIPGPPVDVKLAEWFQVVVDCQDEDQQHAIYDRLIAEGLPCRVLTL